MVTHVSWSGILFALCPGLLSLLLLQGCVATRGWVTEQLSPLAGRVSDTETQLGQIGNRLSGAEALIGHMDAKAERALRQLANLRLEKRFVLDLKEGANFAFDSAVLTDDARRHIDGFLSDLKGDLTEGAGAIYVVAGHTDNTGSEDYNYELGRRRAEAVARHLIIQQKLDPMRLIAVSYGKSSPLAENTSGEGRAKNRRVEILVYREDITTASAGHGSRVEASQSGKPRAFIIGK